MWLLTGIREENQDQVYYIYQSREHTVSRKGGDVTLANDQSISRLHAKIIHGTQDENQILVMDAGSKYGTFLLEDNDEKKKLVADEAIIVKSGSILQFGLQWNVFRLDYMPLVVCPSTLNSAEKSQLKGIVQALNGQLVSDWQENTTHLTMNKITLTVKVVCALGYGKPIVNLEFWNALKNAVETNTKLPNYENYTPPLVEKALHKSKVSFTIDLGRRTLFAGKTFIACCPAQKQRLENMVVAAGGKVISWVDGEFEKEKLLDPEFLIMKPAPNESQVEAQYLELLKYLKGNEIRALGESEIGISVVYCSTEKYCNPRFDFNSNLIRTEASDATHPEGSCLVPETQNATKDSRSVDRMTIPESDPLPTPVNKSRSRLIDDMDEEDSEKSKTELDSTSKVDISRDFFGSTADSRPSTSGADSSSRKRPSELMANDDDADIFDFGSLSKKVESTTSAKSLFSNVDEDGAARTSTGSLSKKPRLCIEDPDDVFNLPDRTASKRKIQDDDSTLENSGKRRISLLDNDISSESCKRRVSLLDDEVDAGSGSEAKRSRLDGLESNHRPPPSTMSQEMRNLNEQMKDVGFKSRPLPIKIKKEDPSEAENDPYVQTFLNKAIVETRDLMPVREEKPAETQQSDEGPNFKKFRKNQVCRANVTRIIGRNALRPFQLQENHDIWGNLIEEEKQDHFPGFDQGYNSHSALFRRGRGR